MSNQEQDREDLEALGRVREIFVTKPSNEWCNARDILEPEIARMNRRIRDREKAEEAKIATAYSKATLVTDYGLPLWTALGEDAKDFYRNFYREIVKP